MKPFPKAPIVTQLEKALEAANFSVQVIDHEFACPKCSTVTEVENTDLLVGVVCPCCGESWNVSSVVETGEGGKKS